MNRYLIAALSIGVITCQLNAQVHELLVSPDGDYQGVTYTDALTGYWDWAFSFPSTGGCVRHICHDGENVHPLVDGDGSSMHINNDGDVYNLSVSWRKEETIMGADRDPISRQEDRFITVKHDQAMLAPFAGWVGWPRPTDSSEWFDEDFAAAENAGLFDRTIFRIGLTIDGEEIPIDDALDGPFRVSTVQFDVAYPEDSGLLDVYGLTPDDADHPSNYEDPFVIPHIVNDAFMTIIKPLSVGEHTVELYGRNVLNGRREFTTDIKYHVTVLDPGDFNENGILDVEDVDIVRSNIDCFKHPTCGQFVEPKHDVDLNDDGTVNVDDLTVWVKDHANTWFGDANLDGEFNSGDLVAVFQAGKYEENPEFFDSIADWSTGDWNADFRFDSGDLVVAFQDGGFEQGPRAATVAVPEPTGLIALPLFLLFGGGITRRRDNAKR